MTVTAATVVRKLTSLLRRIGCVVRVLDDCRRGEHSMKSSGECNNLCVGYVWDENSSLSGVSRGSRNLPALSAARQMVPNIH